MIRAGNASSDRVRIALSYEVNTMKLGRFFHKPITTRFRRDPRSDWSPSGGHFIIRPFFVTVITGWTTWPAKNDGFIVYNTERVKTENAGGDRWLNFRFYINKHRHSWLINFLKGIRGCWVDTPHQFHSNLNDSCFSFTAW